MCSCTGCNAGEMEDCAAAMARGLQQERARRPCGNGWKRCQLAVMYPTRHLCLSHPHAEGLLIKPKLDTGSNYRIASHLALIQALVLSVCFEGSPAAERGSKDRNEQLCIVCHVSHCDYSSGDLDIPRGKLLNQS